MLKKLTIHFALWALLSVAASAATYKCKQADGRMAFQDQPCQAGSAGEQITIVVTPPSGPPLYPPAKPSSPSELAREREEWNQRAVARDRDEQAQAYNRAVKCNAARRNLGALNSQRRLFRYDNKGERAYLDDAARASELAASQQGVAENCH